MTLLIMKPIHSLLDNRGRYHPLRRKTATPLCLYHQRGWPLKRRQRSERERERERDRWEEKVYKGL